MNRWERAEHRGPRFLDELRMRVELTVPLDLRSYLPWQDGGVLLLKGKLPLDGLMVFLGGEALKKAGWTKPGSALQSNRDVRPEAGYFTGRRCSFGCGASLRESRVEKGICEWRRACALPKVRSGFMLRRSGRRQVTRIPIEGVRRKVLDLLKRHTEADVSTDALDWLDLRDDLEDAVVGGYMDAILWHCQRQSHL